MPDFNKIFLFRITHLENIPHILEYGITHISSANCNPGYVPLGDGSLINTRSAFAMTNGKRLGDYIPFYFGYRMPMLYVILKGFNGVKAVAPKDIVYWITTVESVIQSGLEYVFTDGHAVDGFTCFFSTADIDNIENLIDKVAINRKYWTDENDLDLKRRKEAEFLVLGDIPPERVLGFAVYNEVTGNQVQQMPHFGNRHLIIKPEYYFWLWFIT